MRPVRKEDDLSRNKDGLGKSPGFWLFTRDLERDFQILSLRAQGLAIRMICWMSENEAHRGFLELPTGHPMIDLDIIAKIGKSKSEVISALAEMDRLGLFSRDDRGCIYNRRMARDTHISGVRSEAAKRRMELCKRAEGGAFAGDFAPAKQPAKEQQKPTVSDSVSDSVSDKSKTPPDDASKFDFEDWFESLYTQWPIKGMKCAAQEKLANNPRVGDASWRALVSAKCIQWAEYTAQPFHKKRTMYEWFADEGWKDEIPVEVTEKRAISKLEEVFREA